MRWPWQPRPGMVRLSKDALIELQRRAVRAAQLEQETRVIRGKVAQVQAVIVLRSAAAELVDDQALAEVLADLPLTSEGAVHEPAVLALYDARVWTLRDRELAALVTSAGDVE